jgi:hypothetical protein
VSLDFVKLLLVLIGIAVALGLVIAALVFMGGRKDTKRYRPGRPFAFAPVWFLAAPERQSRAGITGELPAGPTARVARPRETGGASDRW